MNKKGGELVSDGLCGLGFPLIPVFLSEEKRYSGSLSLQWREGIQVPSPFSGEKVFRFPLPSVERRCSGSHSLQRRDGVQIPPLLKGGGNQVPSPLRGEG